MNCLLIIDGSSLLSASFYGTIPKQYYKSNSKEDFELIYNKIMQTSYGVHTNGIYAFSKTFFSILKNLNPSHIAVCWDLSKQTFRRELYPKYKANRNSSPNPLQNQFILMQSILSKSNVSIFGDYYYEADDYIGSLVEKFHKEIPIIIYSRDEDFFQLINDNTVVWWTNSKVSSASSKFNIKTNKYLPKNTVEVNNEIFKLITGLNNPKQIIDLKGLCGDESDNIPGIKGIGKKRATQLVNYYGSLEKLYEDIMELDEMGILQKQEFFKKHVGIRKVPIDILISQRKIAELSKILATIKTDISDIEHLALEDLRCSINFDAFKNELEFLEITTLI